MACCVVGFVVPGFGFLTAMGVVPGQLGRGLLSSANLGSGGCLLREILFFFSCQDQGQTFFCVTSAVGDLTQAYLFRE